MFVEMIAIRFCDERHSWETFDRFFSDRWSVWDVKRDRKRIEEGWKDLLFLLALLYWGLPFDTFCELLWLKIRHPFLLSGRIGVVSWALQVHLFESHQNLRVASLSICSHNGSLSLLKSGSTTKSFVQTAKDLMTKFDWRVAFVSQATIPCDLSKKEAIKG